MLAVWALRALKKANAHVTESDDEKGEEQMMMALEVHDGCKTGNRVVSRSKPKPPPLSFTGDDQEFFRAQQISKHLPTCPQCGGNELERAALQTRSSDEGPTIYMKCSVCKNRAPSVPFMTKMAEGKRPAA